MKHVQANTVNAEAPPAHGEPGMPVGDAIARRVSCRAYQPTPVPKSQLMQILEAARLVPSACNQQPWRFAVVRDLDLRRRIVEEGFLPGIKMAISASRGSLTCGRHDLAFRGAQSQMPLPIH